MPQQPQEAPDDGAESQDNATDSPGYQWPNDLHSLIHPPNITSRGGEAPPGHRQLDNDFGNEIPDLLSLPLTDAAWPVNGFGFEAILNPSMNPGLQDTGSHFSMSIPPPNPAPVSGKRSREQMEQDEGNTGPPVLEQRNVRPRRGDIDPPPGNDQICHPSGHPSLTINRAAQDWHPHGTSIDTSNQLSALSNSERYSFHVFLRQPLPSPNMTTIRHRRCVYVKMGIIIGSPSTPNRIPWDGIRLPYTFSVKNRVDDSTRPLLQLNVVLLATESEETIKEVCEKCKSREGKRMGAGESMMGLVDFRSESDVLDLHEGQTTIVFRFICDSKHHGKGSDAFRVRVVLRDDTRGVVVQKDLSHSFFVEPKPKRPEPANSSHVDPHRQLAGSIQPFTEACGSTLPIVPMQGTDAPLPTHHHIRETGHYETTPQSRHTSPLRTLACTVPSTPSAGIDPGANLPTSRAEGSLDASAGPSIVLEELSPDNGPMTGGIKILLVGPNFPLSPLFVRFGRNVTMATYVRSTVLRCTLPPSKQPGLVEVTLSFGDKVDSPVVGKSSCWFSYYSESRILLEFAVRIGERQNGDPVLAAKIQALISASQDSGGSSTSRTNINNTLNASMERPFIEFLAAFRENPDFNDLVSISNEYGQTLAHVAVLFGYYSLLSNLLEWGINLSRADSSGCTALHFAYLRDDARSIVILRAAGASEFALDDMGRVPHQLGFCAEDDLSENEADSNDDSFSTISSDHVSSVSLGATRSEVKDTSLENLEALKSREMGTTIPSFEDGSTHFFLQDTPQKQSSSSHFPAERAPAPAFTSPSDQLISQISELKIMLQPRYHERTRLDPTSCITRLDKRIEELIHGLKNYQKKVLLAAHSGDLTERTAGQERSSPDAHPIHFQLGQLYAMLRGFYPEWCRANPFSPLVQGRSYPQLYELHKTWTQWVEYYQAQPCAPIPVVDAVEQQPNPDYFGHTFNYNLDSHLPFELGISISLDCSADSGQATTPQQLDTGGNYQPMARGYYTPVLTHQATLPLTAVPVEMNPDDGTTNLPDWLSLDRPQPEGDVVNVRRECQVVLDIKSKELPSLSGQRPVKWKGLVIPSTANVKTKQDHGGEDVLHIAVRVLGADTKREYKAVCDACSKREGKKKGEPSLVDFYAASNFIKASEDGIMQVKFKFSCYPKHQNPGECAYLLEVMLLEKKHQENLVPSQGVVAACRLPWNFRVGKQKAGESAPAAPVGGTVSPQNGADNLSRQQSMFCDTPTSRGIRAPTQEPMVLTSGSPCSLSEGAHQEMPYVPYSDPPTPAARRPGTIAAAQPLRRKQGREEDGTEPQDADWGRRVRPRYEQKQRNTAGSDGLSATVVNPSCSQSAATAAGSWTTKRTDRRGVPSNGTPSSPATSASSASQLDLPNMEPNLSLRSAQVQQDLSQPSETHNTLLHATNPRSGPVSGGIEIWLDGEDLPTTFALFARFGESITQTTVRTATTLSCILPCSGHSGSVKVTLSRSVYPGGPEYGTSLATFTYHSDHAQLIPLLLRMEEKARPEYTPTIRAILRMLQGDDAPQDDANARAGQIEMSLLKALPSLREQPNFDDIVSTSNDSRQTLAHLSVLFGYISLLENLVDWRIDLTIADISGLTALHCAYLKEDRESIRILLSAGASPSVKDKLGRVPRDLAPVGSDLVNRVEEIGTGVGSLPIEHPTDQEVSLGEQHYASGAEEEYGSGHGGSECELATPNKDRRTRRGPQTPDTDPPTSATNNTNRLLIPRDRYLDKNPSCGFTSPTFRAYRNYFMVELREILLTIGMECRKAASSGPRARDIIQFSFIEIPEKTGKRKLRRKRIPAVPWVSLELNTCER